MSCRDGTEPLSNGPMTGRGGGRFGGRRCTDVPKRRLRLYIRLGLGPESYPVPKWNLTMKARSMGGSLSLEAVRLKNRLLALESSINHPEDNKNENSNNQ